MRLYLSSYRLGDHTEQLNNLLGGDYKVAIIENALDAIPPEARRKYRQQNYDIFTEFRQLGFNPSTLDLQDYFSQTNNYEDVLDQFDLIWAVGGNTFLLRYAMHKSGFDKALKKALENDRVAYGGWSAGICVLAPTLEGIEPADEPEMVSEIHDDKIIWDGLNILDFVPLPHYKSDHHESVMIDDCVDFCKQNSLPYKTLQDGDVIIRRKGELEVLTGNIESKSDYTEGPIQE